MRRASSCSVWLSLAGITVAAALGACSAVPGESASGEPGGPGASGGQGGFGGFGEPGGACSVAREVPVSEGEATAPAIAFGGGHFAVAWTDLRNDKGDVYLALFDKKGERLAAPVAIAVGTGEAKLPSVAALPAGGFVVGWQDAGGAVRARRVTAEGSLQGETITVTPFTTGDAHPDVVATAKGVVVTWMDGPSVLTSHLTEIAAEPPNMMDGGFPALAPVAGSDDLGMVWTSGNLLAFGKLALPMPAPGTSPTQGTLFRRATGRANAPRISATAAGAFDVVWEDNRLGDGNESVFFSRVDRDGKVGAEIAVPKDTGSADYPDVVSFGDKGERSAIVYYQFRDGPPSVYLAVLEPDLTHPHADLQVSGKRPARFARIARGNGQLGVVYAERSGPVRLALITCK